MAKKTRKKKAKVINEPVAEAPRITLTPMDQILGHDRAIDVLMGAIRSERVHHAWVFQGPLGVGKCTAAVAFASLLLDPTTQPNMAGVIEPDPDSHTQRLLRAGTHPDLHVVTKELARFSDDAQIRGRKLMNIPLDVLRERVLEPAALAPSVRTSARASKVFIVDEAELIDVNGQNALLKTLEEPPPGTVLILVTSQPERLLPTIRSRCQRVTFAPLADDQMRAWIDREAADDASPLANLAAADLDALLVIADGAPGLAMLAAATGMSAWPGLLEPKLDDLDAGRPIPDLGRTMSDLVGDWASGWVDAHEGASKEAANKAGSRHMFRLVAGHYRRKLRAGDAERASRAIDAISEVEATARWNVQAQFIFEELAAKLSVVR